MTQEHKDLLLKDLCVRLPYGVIIQDKCVEHDKMFLPNKDEDRLISIDLSDGTLMTNVGIFHEVDEMKPYLFPLSSMTEEQENEWTDLRLNPLGAILEGKFNGKEEHMQLLSKSLSDPIQWCYKNHFDCNGLIPLGLAIDATNLNIY